MQPLCRSPQPRVAAESRLLPLGFVGGLPFEAAPFLATVSGGLVSGDWGGTPVTDGSYSLTTGYAPNLFQAGTLAGSAANYVGVPPTIRIDTGFGPLSGTLQPFTSFTWHLFSLAVTANESRSGFAPIDASLNVTNAFDIEAALPQSTLLTQVAFGGGSDANDPVTRQTSAGVLEITASTDAAGTFAIVPEPGGLAVLGITLVALVGRRRFTKA